MSYPTDRPATWLVTGASRGLGLALVRRLLERGDIVAATTRSAERRGQVRVERMSEALAGEMAEFGVKVTIVEPGYFRTDFLTTDPLALPRETTDAYPGIREMTRQHLDLQGASSVIR